MKLRTITFDESTHKLVPRELGRNHNVSSAMGFAIDSELGTVEIYRRTIAAVPEYSNESLGQNSIDIIKEINDLLAENPPHKQFESYVDGWTDALNQLTWALEQLEPTTAQAQQPSADEWSNAQAIADMSLVEEALRGFSEDPTGDNGTMVVREVMRAVAAQAQQPEKPFIYISEDEFAWRSKSGDLNGCRALTCITPQHFGETHYRNFTVPLYLQPQAQQPKVCGNCIGTGIEIGVHGNRPCGFCQSDSGLAVQAQQPKIDQLKMIEIQDVLEALDADKTKGEVVNGNFDDATTAELPNLSSSAARVIRFLLAAQAQQEAIGEVQHYAAPANLPAYVNVKWHGKPPKNGAKVYALPPAPEGGKG